MKKSIIILPGGVVVISLLWLVDKTFLTKKTVPNSADKQRKSAVARQGSSTEKKPKIKPKFKPPVYDLSNKAHWYNPETTVGLYESQTLTEWLEPFKPSSKEFQIVAQYETSRKKIKESLSEDEYYSVDGRQWLIDETLKLNRVCLH